MTAAAHRAAILTPPGSGAIAVVRVSGPDAVGLVAAMFEPKGNATFAEEAVARIRYGHLVEAGEVIDDVLACVVDEGDNQSVEICLHGGVRVVERALEALSRAGAPLAETTGAVPVWFAANRIEGEALDLLPTARTERAVRFLAWQRTHLADSLHEIASMCGSDAAAARVRLETLAARYADAEVLIHGVSVALVGPPNSGKSALFNQLVQRPAAVVSSRSGTTRDWVTASIEMHGIPVTLMDTAGRHAAQGRVERSAIDGGVRASRTADVRILVLDASQPFPDCLGAFGAATREENWVVVANKSDLTPAWAPKDVAFSCSRNRAVPVVTVSAARGTGMDGLAAAICDWVGLTPEPHNQVALFTRRQADACGVAVGLLPTAARQAERIIKQELI